MCYPNFHKKLYSYEEEAEVFRVIRAGEAAEKLLASTKSLDIDTHRKLQVEAEAGRSAKTEFINSNIPLCIAAAKAYHTSFILIHPEQKDDLISEATIGLMRAVDKFDAGYGTKFSTYAMFWIRRFMQRYIFKNFHHLSGSVSTFCKYSKVTKFVNDYVKEHDVYPSVELTASETEINIKLIRRFLMVMQPPVRLDQELRALSECFWEEAVYEKHDILPSEIIDFDENLTRQEMIDLMQNHLCSREIRIMKDYFGFNSFRKTYDEIGKELGITNERVRQILNRSLCKLKDAYIGHYLSVSELPEKTSDAKVESGTDQNNSTHPKKPKRSDKKSFLYLSENGFVPSSKMDNYFLVYYKVNNKVEREICIAKNKHDVCENYKNYDFYIFFDSGTKEFIKNRNKITKIIDLL